MKFEDYRIVPEIKKALAKMGFNRPTDIQFKSIPNILKGEDLLAIAQTGTGKTAAFAIPVLHQIQVNKNTKRSDGVKCLVMVPTRELALQIQEVFLAIGKYTKINIFALTGGVEQEPQIKRLNDGVDVLIATPGRMFDLIAQKHLNLHRVSTLILDEADKMLALGFYKDIQGILGHLPKYRQSLFFSATINEEIKTLAHSIVKNAIRIQIAPKDPVSKNVNHFVAHIEMDDKRFFLEQFIKDREGKKIIVFVRTKVRAERVHKAMERVNIKTMTLHSDKDQKERVDVMNKFKSGENLILIATDISARGVDIPNVEYVVNYDLPDVAENYVHRVGRTGRGNARGEAISFCSPEELPVLKEIEAFTHNPIKVVEIKKDEYQNVVELSDAQDLKTLLNTIEKELEYKHKKRKSQGKKTKKKK